MRRRPREDQSRSRGWPCAVMETEVATVLQRSTSPTPSSSSRRPNRRSSDSKRTLWYELLSALSRTCRSLAALAGPDQRIPVAAGLEAGARCGSRSRARELDLPEPLSFKRSVDRRRSRRGRPVLPLEGAQLGTGDGTSSRSYSPRLCRGARPPDAHARDSTAAVYRAFDDRGAEGFEAGEPSCSPPERSKARGPRGFRERPRLVSDREELVELAHSGRTFPARGASVTASLPKTTRSMPWWPCVEPGRRGSRARCEPESRREWQDDRPALGRGQVVRHRVLVPGSQVRILAPQPSCRRTTTRVSERSSWPQVSARGCSQTSRSTCILSWGVAWLTGCSSLRGSSVPTRSS